MLILSIFFNLQGNCDCANVFGMPYCKNPGSKTCGKTTNVVFNCKHIHKWQALIAIMDDDRIYLMHLSLEVVDTFSIAKQKLHTNQSVYHRPAVS